MDFLADALALGEVEAGKLLPSLPALDTTVDSCPSPSPSGACPSPSCPSLSPCLPSPSCPSLEEEVKRKKKVVTGKEERARMASEKLLLDWEAPGASNLEEQMKTDDSPPFHGFAGKLPDKLEIIETPDNIKVVRKKRKGRPRGLQLGQKAEQEETVAGRRRPSLPEQNSSKSSPSGPAPAPAPAPAHALTSGPVPDPSLKSSTSISSPKIQVGGTSNRPVIYLLDQPPTSSIGFTKLPKTIKVLQLMFHFLLQSSSRTANSNPLTLATKAAAKEAASQALKLVKSVWRHHFGIRLIDGKVQEDSVPDMTIIMIKKDSNNERDIMKMFQQWKLLEQLSRRPDRSKELKAKEAKFRDLLD